ncbi:hypothetical protein Pmani_011081 [Petrolisthes manimaculis]|uniref:DNA/RNA non-specific endonuclease/pyrophosphatase/phosphodiesterase domain-containing protein n=1 Tax=Petrolisthes manimaculis TaxID=1843537 RepID=A0AAE1Q330_9EUCA|nr:hypothetical protein Pmani_011081 [Petrolisthes manimaculis]
MAQYQALIFLSLVLLVAGNDCIWDTSTSFPEFSPLMLDSDLEMILPVLEGETSIVRVAEGSNITLVCPGSAINATKLVSAVATCIGDTQVTINDKTYSLKELGCLKKPKPSIKKGVGNCGVNGTDELHAIGFKIAPFVFYESVRVCFDGTTQTTLYTDHVLRGAHIAAKEVTPGRPGFKTGSGFYSVSMSRIYTKKSQLALMVKLLGSETLASTIINGGKQLYFSKGHMSPDADFVTEALQDATYFYINALPQWQAFNNGNWKQLEFATRTLAEEMGSDLRIYSGGWGVLQLPDVNNNPVDIHLGLTDGEQVVPAPAVTWKVVHDEKTGRAVAIIGVNNPHITSVPDTICPNICTSLEWVTFAVTELEDGYTYCCTVDDLRKAVPYVPDIGTVKLLASPTSGCRL